MKKLLTLFVCMLVTTAYTQVGINTNSPNGSSVLDVVSSEKGILIPRLSDTERDSYLSDNDIATVPPAGVVNTSITEGLLIFNTTENAFQYWDGVLWKQLFVGPATGGGNDGVVKINSGDGASEVKPTFSLSHQGNSYGPPVTVEYEYPLNYASPPTTDWPENIASPTDQDIYNDSSGSKLWIENAMQGQVHVWRLIVTVGSGASSSGSLLARFRNLDSGFEVNSIQLLPQGSQGGNVLTFYFYTVADTFSIGTGKGYTLTLQADEDCSITVESFTRISLLKTN